MAEELGRRVAAGEPVFEAFMDLNRLHLDAVGVIESLPATGGVIVIANHPFGGADAVAMAAMVARVRPDARILANAELLGMPGMDEWLLPLQILGEAGAESANFANLRRALRHVRSGGLLVMFPAGAVAHWQWQTGRVEDPPWPGHAARLVGKTGTPVLPVRFFGANGAWFQLLGAIHPLIRSALIPRAYLSMGGKCVRCRAGKLLTPGEMPGDSEELTAVLRAAVEGVQEDVGN